MEGLEVNYEEFKSAHVDWYDKSTKVFIPIGEKSRPMCLNMLFVTVLVSKDISNKEFEEKMEIHISWEKSYKINIKNKKFNIYMRE